MRNRVLSNITLILSLAIVLSAVSNPGDALAQQSSFFAQDLTLHQTTTSAGMGGRGDNKSAEATTYFSRDAIRANSAESYDTIIRFGEGKMITIDHKKKTYTELTLQELQDKLDKMAAEMGKNKEEMEALQKMMGKTAGPMTVTKVGPGESIAGYATEKYVISGPMEWEIWAAPALKIPAAYYDAMKLRAPANPMIDMRKLYDEFKKIDGMTMKTVMTLKMMGMSSTTTTVVNSVDKTPIPPDTFQVPAGYKVAPVK